MTSSLKSSISHIRNIAVSKVISLDLAKTFIINGTFALTHEPVLLFNYLVAIKPKKRERVKKIKEYKNVTLSHFLLEF